MYIFVCLDPIIFDKSFDHIVLSIILMTNEIMESDDLFQNHMITMKPHSSNLKN